MFNGSGLKRVAAFLMGVKCGNFAKPHHSFYSVFDRAGAMNSCLHVAYAVADVVFTLWAYQQKTGAILGHADPTVTQRQICLTRE